MATDAENGRAGRRGRLAERRWGHGGQATVVGVHGLVVATALLEPTARLLGERCSVLAPDLPGFGGSAGIDAEVSVPSLAGALLDWMEAEKIEAATLVGTSFGCQIAADAATRRPDLVDRLVLAAPTLDPRARPLRALLPRWAVEQSTQSSPLRKTMLRDYARAGPRRALRTLEAARADRIEDKLPRCPQPALVIGGTRDPIARESWCEQVAGLLPRGQLEIIEQAPHAMLFEAPEAVAAAIDSFLERTAPPA